MINMSIDAINHNDIDESKFRKIAPQDLHLIKEKIEIQKKRTAQLQMILSCSISIQRLCTKSKDLCMI